LIFGNQQWTLLSNPEQIKENEMRHK